MDQNEIIQKIVAEVMARMASGGANQAQPAQAGPQAPAKGSGGAGIGSGATILPSDLPKYIDHTLLKPEATPEQIDALCDEAAKHKFWSVCVNSSWVSRCARKLGGTGVKVCAVVGFPLGAMDARTKGLEARAAIADGASEIDMVMNIGAMKAKDLKKVREDMLSVRRACRPGIVLKVILETCLLTDEEKVLACQIAQDIGADFVKTSTGFSKGGATTADIALMRRTVGPNMGVKASGGVKSFDDAVLMIRSGANRLGTSSGIAIVSGQSGTSAY